MKKTILYLAFTISILSSNLLANELIGTGTIDDPRQISCESCYTDLDFKNTAKSNVPNNESHYYLIYNLNTQVLKTVLAFRFIDWESGLNISNSRIVTTKSDHQAEFVDYIDWVNSGAEKSDINLDYPSTGPTGATGYQNYIANFTAPLVLQQWVQASSNLGLFTFRAIKTVTVTFQNGDVATFAVTGYASAVNFPLLLVVDNSGHVVALVGASASILHGGGDAGSSGGWTDFILPNGVTICYGECPVRDGIVTITRDG